MPDFTSQKTIIIFEVFIFNVSVKSGLYHIIVADDDVDDQFFIKEAIRNYTSDVELISVYNGLELVQWLAGADPDDGLQTPMPDLIILDLNMPIMDGVAALSKIREIQNYSDIPIYILTTSKEEKDEKICMQLGARGFFTKPSEFASLQRAVNTMLGDLKNKNQSS